MTYTQGFNDAIKLAAEVCNKAGVCANNNAEFKQQFDAAIDAAMEGKS